MATLKNLLQPKRLGSGIADTLLIAPAYWLTKIAVPKPPYTDPGDEVTVFDDHVFDAGRGFIEILLAPFKNDLTATMINEKPSQTFEQVLKVFIPGSYAELHETFKNLKNIPLLVLARDAECTEELYYQLGGCDRYTYLKGNFTTGTTRDGVKGYDVSIVFLNPFIQIYEGQIELFGPEDGVSSVFLAAVGVEQITGNVSALQSMNNNAQSRNIATIYQLLLDQADAEVISIGFANSIGNNMDDHMVQADLSSLDNFIVSIYDWLALNTDGKHVELVDGQLRLFDENADAAYLGIAVPLHLLGGDDFALLVDDDIAFTIQ